jgi:hypothetical protein
MKARCSGFLLKQKHCNEQLASLARPDLIEQSRQPMPSLCELPARNLGSPTRIHKERAEADHQRWIMQRPIFSL